MPLLDSFCTWFSVRMGSIIVAFISLVQSLVFLILLCVTLRFRVGISSDMKHALDQYDFLFIQLFVAYFQEVSILAIIFVVIHISTSLGLIHASYQLKIWQIWPFIICDLIKLLLLTATYVACMMIIRKNVLDFNITIVCLTVGGFYLMFQYYLWLCPVSLLQCLLNVKNDKLKTVNKTDIDQLIFYNYQSEFQFKTVLPIHNYYRYHYGNLPKLNF